METYACYCIMISVTFRVKSLIKRFWQRELDCLYFVHLQIKNCKFLIYWSQRKYFYVYQPTKLNTLYILKTDYKREIFYNVEIISLPLITLKALLTSVTSSSVTKYPVELRLTRYCSFIRFVNTLVSYMHSRKSLNMAYHTL